MSRPQTNTLLRHIRRIAADHHGRELSDPELLERFLQHRDEAAFTTLLLRHGSMVQAVCRSIVNDCHLTEDAFQATFLLLARKAASIRKRASLGSWLHGVRHMAMKARAAAVKHRVQEEKNERMETSDPWLDMNVRELQAVLRQPRRRLKKQRAPWND